MVGTVLFDIASLCCPLSNGFRLHPRDLYMRVRVGVGVVCACAWCVCGVCGVCVCVVYNYYVVVCCFVPQCHSLSLDEIHDSFYPTSHPPPHAVSLPYSLRSSRS